MQFICGHCQKFFKNKKSLNTHTSKIHKSKRFYCDCCNDLFDNKKELIRHLNRRLQCDACKKFFTKISSLNRHKNKYCDKLFESDLKFLSSAVILCVSCNEHIEKRYLTAHQKSFKHNDKLAKMFNQTIDTYKTALNKNVVIYRYKNKNENNLDIQQLFDEAKSAIIALMEHETNRLKTTNIRLSHIGYYRKPSTINDNTEEEANVDFLQAIKQFSSNYYTCRLSTEFEQIYQTLQNQVMTKIEEFQARNSGIVIKLVYI